MKVTDKLLSLPPYISTAWKNIVALQMENRPFGHVLVIELSTGNKVEVPNLDGKTVQKIFATHAEVIESAEKLPSQTFTLPLLEGFPTVLQHNPEQADAAPIPPDVLENITRMTKDMVPTDHLPKAEPHCNCPHCQIMRAMHGTSEPAAAMIEEEVSAADLTFKTWDIQQQGDQLFSVTNPLDEKEHYNVFLGNPLGCTCGQNNCEHIQAVLRS